jgi:hypothetical protein
MKLSPSQEVIICTATQEFHNILWTLKIYHCVHRSSQLVLLLSPITSVYYCPQSWSFTHPLVTASNSGLSLYSVFPNCPRASVKAIRD